MFHDISWKQKVLTLATFLPLNLIGRNQERLQVARALSVAHLCSSRILSIQVDGIYMQFPKNEEKILEKRFRSIRYCDLNGLATALSRSLAKIQQTPNRSEALVYKCEEKEPRYPGGTLKTAEHVDQPIPEAMAWNMLEEPREGPDEFIETILAQVRIGKSFTCLGQPGTGKTWTVGRVREALEEAGERVVCLAPTHCAARLIDGTTVHNFVGRYAMQGSFKGTILCDEISMCCLPLLAALDQLRLNGTKIATFGDWAQLPPHPESNSWRGQPVDAAAFERSRLYKSWSDCTQFILTRCRRSDAEHFQFYTNLPNDLRKAVALSRQRYPLNGEVDLHICISHRQRRAISASMQVEAAKGKTTIRIPGGDDPEYDAYEGTRIVGNCTSGKFVNGARYVMSSFSNGCILLKDEATAKEFEATPKQVGRCTLLAHAMVHNKVQGSTMEGTVCLHGCSSQYFRKCHLYVGLSRTTAGSRVHVASD